MTREIANWFHENTGELFTIDETPFDRQDLRPLTDDSVDPVQQIIVDGERYYGVIDYAEHEGWYEYTRYDDAAGRVQIGVCAQCVQEAEHVADVARTLGDPTDVASEKLAQHYDADHTEAPDEVETGATLVSGTTINSNSVIHAGMDGPGSNVDADVVRGAVDREEGVFYPGVQRSGGKGIIDQIGTPSSSPVGLSFNSNDSIWHSDSTANSIYEMDQGGSVQSQFSAPSTNTGVVAVDDQSCLWMYADPVGDSMYRTNQSGTVDFQDDAYSNNATGLTHHGLMPQYLSEVDASNSCMWLINHPEYNSEAFDSPPGPEPRGIGGAAENFCLWHIDNSNKSLYELDPTNKNVERTIPSPGGDSAGHNYKGLGVDSNNCIWVVDDNNKSVYKVARYDHVKFD